MKKPVKAKPSFYAHCFEMLKRIAETYGYNLVLHGSMDRDLDLIAIPWEEEVGSYKKMICDFGNALNAKVTRPVKEFSEKPHGRIAYIIDINRRSWDYAGHDYQYYIDLSIMPTRKNKDVLNT